MPNPLGKKSPAPAVLLLDDNHEYRQTMAMMLRREGYRVMQAEKSAALEKTRTDPPALVLMELTTNSANDFELASQLQVARSNSAIPVVYYATEEIKNQISDSTVEVLAKPIPATRVGETLRRHLSEFPDRPRPIASPGFTASK